MSWTHILLFEIFFLRFTFRLDQCTMVFFNVNTECALMRPTKFVIIYLSYYCPKSYYYIIVEIVIRDTIQFVKNEIYLQVPERNAILCHLAESLFVYFPKFDIWYLFSALRANLYVLKQKNILLIKLKTRVYNLTWWLNLQCFIHCINIDIWT